MQHHHIYATYSTVYLKKKSLLTLKIFLTVLELDVGKNYQNLTK